MTLAAPTGRVWSPRYELLDGLRGLAALAVVLQHLGVGSAGHFAVMVFFVISGYCITASAESCRRNGTGFKEFMLRRIRRIYPPYLLAVAFFALTRIAKTALGAHDDLRRPITDWVQNVTLTQWLSNLVHPVASADSNPTLFVTAFWSLNYEEQFYLVMAGGLLLAMRRRVSLIAPVLALAAVALIWNWRVPGGWICGLFIEYWMHFSLGALLFFSLCICTDRIRQSAFVLFAAALGTASLLRILFWNGAGGEDLRAMIELSFLSAVALALFFLRPLSSAISASAIWRPIAALGTISYSLYLVHQFNLRLVESAVRRLLPIGTPHYLLMAAITAMHIALAALFWFGCERPFLGRNAARRQSPPKHAEDRQTA